MQNEVALKYEFRGYRLLKLDYTRIKDGPLKSFSIVARKHLFDEKNDIFEIITEINIVFGEETSKFIFSAGFKINDKEWLEIMADPTVVTELFNVAFPFIREKVFAYTSDFRPGFIMPTFNPKQFDFTKNVNFNLEVRKVPAGAQPNKPDTNLVN